MPPALPPRSEKLLQEPGSVFSSAVVLAARAGYDPYAFLDVLTTIDSINPDSSELTVLMNTHPPTSNRLETLARKMDGRLDSYAPGVDNADRFRRIAASR